MNKDYEICYQWCGGPQSPQNSMWYLFRKETSLCVEKCNHGYIQQNFTKYCLKCADGQKTYNGQCVQDCPSNYYIDDLCEQFIERIKDYLTSYQGIC